MLSEDPSRPHWLSPTIYPLSPEFGGQTRSCTCRVPVDQDSATRTVRFD